MIQRILDEEGVPREIIHLAQAESGFFPRAVSNKQATGMWQFVSFRGKQYGLNQTPYQDDRLDPERATRAAARHLHDLYNEFGDWYLALAAYNCGPGVIERAVERTGYADFFELRNRGVIPLETTNYVPIILAMTIMAKNAPEYGLEGLVPDAPMEYDQVEVTAPTHLALVADLTDAPLSELASLNPALLKNIAPVGYSLRVPKGSATSLQASLEMIPTDRRLSWRMHKVAEGETLASISRQFGAAAGVIAAANKLQSAEPVAGDRLVIPAVYRAPVAASQVRRTTVGARATTARRTSTSAAPAAHRTGAAAPRAAAARSAAVHSNSAHTTPTTRTPVKRKPPKVLTNTAENRQ
jgi:membrane-bound lytic murein transglycosylase D